MEKIKFITLHFFVFINLIAQAQQAPPVAWKTVDWAPTTPNGPMAIQHTNPLPPGATQGQDQSGEDWWYDLTNIYENGDHVGYMTCGFTRWPGYAWDAHCVFDGSFTQVPHCVDRHSGDETMSPYAHSIARYDLEGNMIWCKAYSLGGDGLFAIIRDVDGNYVSVGNAEDIFDIQGNELTYYHDPFAIPFLLSSTPDCSTLSAKIVVTKTSPDGTVLFNNIYDHLPYNSGATLSFGAFGVDLVEKPGGGYVVLGMGVTDPGPTDAERKMVLFDISSTGGLNDTKLYGFDDEVATARNIIVDGSGNYYVTGQTGPVGAKLGLVFKLDANLNLHTDWGATWGSANQPFIIQPLANTQTIGQDLIEDVNGDIIVSALHCVGGCNSAGNNQGEAYLHKLDPLTGNEISDATFPQHVHFVRAYDMKVGMVNTSDGGFAFVSSTRSGPAPDIFNDPEYQNGAIIDDFGLYVTAGADNTFCHPGSPAPGESGGDPNYWQTNAYVAKFNSDGTMRWETEFDVDDQDPEFWPGDFKKQECLYRVTEADDGSLVIVGNTSHNMDDYYIAKLFSDCNIYDTYDFATDFTIVPGVNDVWSPTATGQLEYKINAVVTVPAGVTLTITDGFIVKFADSRITGTPCKIVVEPGGELIVDNNAILTASDCPGSMWDGVELRGSAFLPQLPLSSGNQGIVRINDATLQRAFNAIRTIGVNANGTLNWGQTGGVVLADNATFRNNWRAMEFMTYPHPLSGLGVIDNQSNIRDCNFVTDEPLPTPFLRPFAFISMFGVRDVLISGSDFSNIVSQDLVDSDKGMGIVSLDASYKVVGECDVIVPVGTPCPVNDEDRNEFSSLFAGIVNFSGSGTSDINVDLARFTNCTYGMRLEGSYFNDVINSEFLILKGDANFPNNATHFGIFSSSSDGTRIEQNVFSHNGQVGAGEGRNLGVSSGLQGVSPIDIFQNDMNGLETGIQAWGGNNGTQFDCNHFNRSGNTAADVHHSSGSLVAQGNCPAIVDITDPAANQFFGSCNASTQDWQLYSNPSTSGFTYNAYDINAGNFPLSTCHSSNVILNNCAVITPGQPGFIESQSCVPTIVSGNFQAQIQGAQARYQNQIDKIESLNSLYDANDTPGLLSAIATQSPGQVKNALLAASPYLTDDVLKAYLLTSPPNGHVKQLIIANSPVSQDIMDVINGMNLPNGIMNQINAAQTGEPSARDRLDNSVEYGVNRKLSALNDIVRVFLDTNMIDSAIIYLENDNSLEGSCLLVPVAMKRDTVKVKSHIQTIRTAASNFIADGQTQRGDDLNRFCDFHEFLIKIANQEGSYYNMTDAQRAIIENFATTPSVVSSSASGILNFLDETVPYVDAEPYQFNLAMIPFEGDEPDQSTVSTAFVRVKPNPFAESPVIYGVIDHPFNQAEISVWDISGRKLKTETISSQRFELELDMAAYSQGMYLCILIVDGVVLETNQIIKR